jgi:UDP-N-acetylmuramyl tripeptide synthase
MRKFFAILVAEFFRAISQTSGRGSGTALPGLMAMKIEPNIISKLSEMLPKGVIVITGTNGKTTTAKMLAGILEGNGHKVLYNFSGSNLARGIASTLIENTNFWGTKINADIAIFEVDEATMPEIISQIRPSAILVTNLFRDQLDRYGEIDKTAAIIGQAIQMTPESKIILNADDPLVASLGTLNAKSFYFGLDIAETTKSTGAIDSRLCTKCGSELNFSPRYFGHLGNYACPKCNAARPKLNYRISKAKLEVLKTEAIFENSSKIKIKVNLPGLYNLYNALAAASVASYFGVPDSIIAEALSEISSAFGRMENIKVNDKNIVLLLVKNPTGFTQSIETLTYDNKSKNLLLALNDNFADGTDVSWIWDAEIEMLKNQASQVVITGIRAEDLEVRLKYADFNMESVALDKNLESALKTALDKTPSGDTLFIMPTYTAMLDIRRILAKQGLVKGLIK